MPISADHAKILAEQHQRQDGADAGRRQRRENGDRMNVALIQHAEHDVDGDERRQDQPGLSGQRFREFGGVAGIDADDAAGHADPRLDRLDGVDGVAERRPRRQIEAERNRRELRLVRDRQRRRGARQGRDRRQRHLGIERAGQIELRQDRRIALVHRQRFQHHAILVGLAVDGRNLPLREGVVERVGDRLQVDAELAGALAIDVERGAQAALLRFRGDVAEQGIAAQFGDQPVGPQRRPARRRCRSACTDIASGSTGSRSGRPAPAGNTPSCPGSMPPAASGARPRRRRRRAARRAASGSSPGGRHWWSD